MKIRVKIARAVKIYVDIEIFKVDKIEKSIFEMVKRVRAILSARVSHLINWLAAFGFRRKIRNACRLAMCAHERVPKPILTLNTLY